MSDHTARRLSLLDDVFAFAFLSSQTRNDARLAPCSNVVAVDTYRSGTTLFTVSGRAAVLKAALDVAKSGDTTGIGSSPSCVYSCNSQTAQSS